MQMKLLTSLALAGVAASQAITDVIAKTPELSTLGALLQAYPAVATQLAHATNITILAPSNSAFSAFLTTAVNESIAADAGLVPAVLSYHVLTSTVRSTAITAKPAFPKTLLTNATYTNVTGGQVVKAATANGGVVFTTGQLAESHVTTADVAFDGGVVHIIDKVLTIPTSASSTLTAANLTSLAGALTTANLVSTVNTAKDITVFAPLNSGFQAIANLVSALSTQQLATILQYHVVAGTVAYSTTLKNGTVPTLQGTPVTVTVRGDGSIFINDSEVKVADVLIANGVAHVIDNVLNPGNSTATPKPTATAGAPNFSGASGAAPTGASSTGSSTPTAAGVKQVGAMGAAALVGGAAFILANL